MKIINDSNSRTVPFSSIKLYHFFTCNNILYQKLSDEQNNMLNVQNSLWWPGFSTDSFTLETLVVPIEITELHHKVLND